MALDPAFDLQTAMNAGPDYYGPRWSLHYGRPPDARWLESPQVEAVFARIANDPTIDPGATLAGWDEAFRAEAIRLGVRPDAGSANNIMQYARLLAGTITWQQIANEAGSATPSGPGALAAPYLDTLAAQTQTAVNQFRASVPEADSGDASIIALLQSAGANFDAPIGSRENIGAADVRAPMNTGFTGSASGVLSPYPQGGATREAVAMGQGSNQGASPYSGLSSFFGMGANGTYSTYDGGTQQPARSSGIPWLMVAAVAVGAYFLLKKG